MKIEAGKYYRTRDGRKAFVSAVEVPCERYCVNKRIHPVLGYIGVGQCSWTEAGHGDARCETEYDLVDEWREPVTRELTLYLYPNGDVCTVPRLGNYPIGSARVTLIEGQFAEGEK